MQDLDLLDKSGVRQHFRFVANRYDVAKAPWEDIVDTLSEMLRVIQNSINAWTRSWRHLTVKNMPHIFECRQNGER